MKKQNWKPGKSACPEKQWSAGQSGNPQGRIAGGRLPMALDLIAEMLVRRIRPPEIAKSPEMVALMGRPRSAAWVRKQVRTIEAAWQRNAQGDIARLRAEQLATLNQALREAWAAYARSLEERKTVIQEAAEGEGQEGKGKRVRIKRERQIGSHDWMGKIIQIVDRICRLMGLDAPARIEFPEKDIASMSDEELKQIILEAAAHVKSEGSKGSYGVH